MPPENVLPFTSPYSEKPFFYILENNEIAKTDVDGYVKWREEGNHIIRVTEKNGVKVSTVFLGIAELNENELFETLVFGGEQDGLMFRNKDREEAINTHVHAEEVAFED